MIVLQRSFYAVEEKTGTSKVFRELFIEIARQNRAKNKPESRQAEPVK